MSDDGDGRVDIGPGSVDLYEFGMYIYIYILHKHAVNSLPPWFCSTSVIFHKHCCDPTFQHQIRLQVTFLYP